MMENFHSQACHAIKHDHIISDQITREILKYLIGSHTYSCLLIYEHLAHRNHVQYMFESKVPYVGSTT